MQFSLFLATGRSSFPASFAKDEWYLEEPSKHVEAAITRGEIGVPSSGSRFAITREISEPATYLRRTALTTSTRVHLAVWAKLDAVNRTVVSLQNFAFLSVDPMNADPLVSQVSRDKPVLVDRMNRGRRRGVG